MKTKWLIVISETLATVWKKFTWFRDPREKLIIGSINHKKALKMSCDWHCLKIEDWYELEFLNKSVWPLNKLVITYKNA